MVTGEARVGLGWTTQPKPCLCCPAEPLLGGSLDHPCTARPMGDAQRGAGAEACGATKSSSPSEGLRPGVICR